MTEKGSFESYAREMPLSCLFHPCNPCGCGVSIVDLAVLASFFTCSEMHAGSVYVALFLL